MRLLLHLSLGAEELYESLGAHTLPGVTHAGDLGTFQPCCDLDSLGQQVTVTPAEVIDGRTACLSAGPRCVRSPHNPLP